MKPCKTCKGKGWVFTKGTIFTGKYDRFMGMEIPRTTIGTYKAKCVTCFGKGVR